MPAVVPALIPAMTPQSLCIGIEKEVRESEWKETHQRLCPKLSLQLYTNIAIVPALISTITPTGERWKGEDRADHRGRDGGGGSVGGVGGHV